MSTTLFTIVSGYRSASKSRVFLYPVCSGRKILLNPTAQNVTDQQDINPGVLCRISTRLQVLYYPLVHIKKQIKVTFKVQIYIPCIYRLGTGDGFKSLSNRFFSSFLPIANLYTASDLLLDSTEICKDILDYFLLCCLMAL